MSTDPKVEFVDELPDAPRGRRDTKHSRLANELRKNPGKWAKWPFPITSDNGTYALTSQINKGVRASFPPEEFEAVTRNKTVYIRCRES